MNELEYRKFNYDLRVQNNKLLKEKSDLVDSNNLLLSRIKQLELDRDKCQSERLEELLSLVKWFFYSDYYTPVHGKVINYKQVLDEFINNQH